MAITCITKNIVVVELVEHCDRLSRRMLDLVMMEDDVALFMRTHGIVQFARAVLLKDQPNLTDSDRHAIAETLGSAKDEIARGYVRMNETTRSRVVEHILRELDVMLHDLVI